MSIWELREVRRQLEKEGYESINEQLIFDAFERMRQQEEQSVRETKRARRARQRRTDHQGVEQPKTAQEYTTGAEDFQPTKSKPNIKPFEEMEELE